MIAPRPSRGSASALTLLLAAVCFGVFAPSAHGQTVFMYVSNRNGSTVNQITTAGAVSVFSTSNLFGPEGLTIDGAGNLYVASSFGSPTSNSITKITSGGSGSVFASIDPPENLTGIAFDNAGNLFVAAQGTNRILKVTSGGAISTFSAGALFERPFGLAFDGSGNLYAATLSGQKVLKITPDGTASTFVDFGSSNSNNPYGLAFDNAGNLFVSLSASGSIAKIAPNGSVATFFTNSIINGIQGLGVDNTGVLYGVVGQQIIKIEADGSSASVFATISGFDGTNEFLTFAPGFSASPVPEPSTYAALAGLAALGFAWHRRRRQRA